MRSLITAIGVTLVCGAFSLVGIGQEGSPTPGAVDRAQLFDRLAGPRIDVPEDAQGVAPLRQFCPERTDTCRNYWAYTIHFVRNYTIPLRDKELKGEARGRSGPLYAAAARRPISPHSQRQQPDLL